MNADVIPVESIQERDIDMLLLEELIIDESFGKWLINQFNFPPLLRINGAWRSVTGIGMGETDILFSYNSTVGKTFLHVENKINAPFTPDQYLRYQLRAKRLVEKGECKESYCVLIAPNQYCTKQTDFQSLSYENIQAWFAGFSTKRAAFKNQILEIAISKQRRVRTSSEFCEEYWTHFSHNERMLGYNKPTNSTNNEKAQLGILKLPRFTIYHLFEKGKVKISAWKSDVSENEEQIFRSQSRLFFDQTTMKHRFTFDVPVMNTSQEIDPLVLGGIFEKINENVDFIHQLILEAK